MIYCLKGTVTGLSSNSIVLNVGPGVGFELFIPKTGSICQGQEIFFYTYMHWNQENGPTLYGFLTETDKKVFELVISCSGIGPKIGLSVLAQMGSAQFIKAISEQDIQALSSVSGIGTKKAEQMVLQLKHKISSFIQDGVMEDSLKYKNIKEITEVLNSLNYSKPEIVRALDHIKSNYVDKDYSFDQMLRQALSYLSKRT